jgi:hypothetical protein
MCAGSGSLLLPVVKKLALDLAKSDKCTYYKALESIIENNLFAVDRDPTATELIRLNLAIETARFGTPLIDSSKRIVRDDALTTKQVPAASFDLCISNPPYLAWEKVQSDLSDLDGDVLKKSSELFRNSAKPDLWYFFFERALNFTKLGGRIAFVVSDTWIGSERGRDIRRLFESTLTLEKLIHFGYPLFPGSTSCPSILVIRNEPPETEHKINVQSFKSDGKRETAEAVHRGKPTKTWILSQTELNKWLEATIPFADELTAARSRIETDHLPKLREIGLDVVENRLQGKPGIAVRSTQERGFLPVMAGKGFGSNMGYVSPSKVPKDWGYVGKPALLIHRKGPFIETKVVSSCPVIWEGVTVIGCSKNVPTKLFKQLEEFLHSEYFKRWYMMRYSTTWTQGGYIFFKAFVEQYPCPRELAKEILKFTKQLPEEDVEAA